MILTIIVCIFIIITLYFIINKYVPKSYEHFNERYGTRWPKCDNKTFGECMECSDCGYCLKNTGSQCVKGDVHGPYKGTCDRWIHNDPWSNMQWVTPQPNNSRIQYTL